MLNIFWVAQQVVRDTMPIVREIKAHSPNLADQLERAVTSTPLNIAEGSGERAGHRVSRYHTALGSARETRAVLITAQNAGYIGELDEAKMDRIDHVVATLVKVLALHRK